MIMPKSSSKSSKRTSSSQGSCPKRAQRLNHHSESSTMVEPLVQYHSCGTGSPNQAPLNTHSLTLLSLLSPIHPPTNPIPNPSPSKRFAIPSFLSIIFPRITTKKNHVLPALSSSSFSSSSSCSSGSYSSSFTLMNNPFSHPRDCLSRQRSTFRFGVDDDDHGDGDARSPS
ncbi:hypothetical protein LOK49_LG12G03054 [Camellia lanceoleosa]|uniref:Uncharacterized protein n=1 Tax=Camellia lanceoleosa TaxID=1840588 RepID=A0ACC0FV66_9ERIC|nr:hypothetical protein LOK49_LG12G03054 [Camellia lanceoleosa]